MNDVTPPLQLGASNAMNPNVIQLPDYHQRFIDRFLTACQADAGVVAAFLGGSYAKGTVDAYSDLDLSVITTDEAFDEFFAQRGAFLRRLGEVVFFEHFNQPNVPFCIFADGCEVELWFGSKGHLDHLHSGPYRVLLDKTGILTAAVFPAYQPPQQEQLEMLRRLITWFWHDVSHFITAMGRGQLWWAHGQIEDLRRYCVNLARLDHCFAAPAEGYEKVEQALPPEELAPLKATYCPLEGGAMLDAAHVIIRFYLDRAPRLAQTYGLAYPDGLERLLVKRLEHVPIYI